MSGLIFILSTDIIYYGISLGKVRYILVDLYKTDQIEASLNLDLKFYELNIKFLVIFVCEGRSYSSRSDFFYFVFSGGKN